MTKDNILTDHTLIVNEIERILNSHHLDFISSFLPKGSFLVGGYIRDIILKRISEKDNIDIDIVVPSDAIKVGHKIAETYKGKLVILDKEREVVRIILNKISIDIAKQITTTILGDLKSRDFSINSIAYTFENKSLIDPLDGIKDLESSLIRTYSIINLIEDPLRILRCFRFVSELSFYIDKGLITKLIQFKGKLSIVAKERINNEIRRIVKGENALESILLIRKFNIFSLENFYRDKSFLDLKKINYEELNQNEKKKFLFLFFLSQILDLSSLEKYKFSKDEILKIKLLKKWHLIVQKTNILRLNELERFQLHQELEDILPSFIFYLPQNLRLDWLNRWRNRDDKLFHPSNLINGDVLKKYLNVKDGPLLGDLLNYLSMELAYERLENFDEAIYKAKRWIEQNAPKCD